MLNIIFRKESSEVSLAEYYFTQFKGYSEKSPPPINHIVSNTFFHLIKNRSSRSVLMPVLLPFFCGDKKKETSLYGRPLCAKNFSRARVENFLGKFLYLFGNEIYFFRHNSNLVIKSYLTRFYKILCFG